MSNRADDLDNMDTAVGSSLKCILFVALYVPRWPSYVKCELFDTLEAYIVNVLPVTPSLICFFFLPSSSSFDCVEEKLVQRMHEV